MGAVLKCPACGRLIAAIFPLHDCTPEEMARIWGCSDTRPLHRELHRLHPDWPEAVIRSVETDADDAPQEELEAASDLLDRLLAGPRP